MQPGTLLTQQKVTYGNLTLAVYREIAAHLSQIEGIKIVILPQEAEVFDYNQSQVGGLLLEYSPDLDPASLALLQQILSYYGKKQEIDVIKQGIQQG
jgi:hypothetical protein